MKRVIVDYAKLTNEILTLLVEKFPEGYYDSNIIRFRNAQNELIEAVEVRTEDTIYLVKVSTNLADRIENYDEDDEIEDDVIVDDDIDSDEIETNVKPLGGIDIDDDDTVNDDDDDDDSYDKPDKDNGDDDNEDDDNDEDDESNRHNQSEDDDEDDED